MTTLASNEHWKQLRRDVGRLVARRLPTSADVEDVSQDVLLRVWRHGAALRDDERFGAWLSRVAASATADHMRARQKHPIARHEGAEAAAPDPVERDDDATTRALIVGVLRPFIDSLPPHYREAVELSEVEELPHAVIAGRLSLSVPGVKSRVQRGRALLREMIERCCQIGLDVRGAPISCEPKPDAVVPEGCCPPNGAGRPSGC